LVEDVAFTYTQNPDDDGIHHDDFKPLFLIDNYINRAYRREQNPPSFYITLANVINNEHQNLKSRRAYIGLTFFLVSILDKFPTNVMEALLIDNKKAIQLQTDKAKQAATAKGASDKEVASIVSSTINTVTGILASEGPNGLKDNADVIVATAETGVGSANTGFSFYRFGDSLRDSAGRAASAFRAADAFRAAGATHAAAPAAPASAAAPAAAVFSPFHTVSDSSFVNAPLVGIKRELNKSNKSNSNTEGPILRSKKSGTRGRIDSDEESE
jgi:hypothetical protein